MSTRIDSLFYAEIKTSDPTHPDVAGDLLRSANTILALAWQARTLISASDATHAAREGLEIDKPFSSCELVVRGLVALAARRASEIRSDPTSSEKLVRAANKLAKEVIEGTLAQKLVKAWNTSVPHAGVVTAIEQVRKQELDALALSDSIIRAEAKRHLGLVKHQANKAAPKFERRAEELFSFGYQGLLLALRKYDPREYKFSTYAATRISGSIHDGVRQESLIPKRLRTFANKAEAAKEELVQEFHREPTLAELARRIDSDLQALGVLQRLKTSASIEELAAGGVQMSCLVDNADPLHLAIAHQRTSALSQAITTLNTEDAQAIKLLIIDNITVAEACRQSGISKRVLQQRCSHALEQLRASLSEWDPTA